MKGQFALEYVITALLWLTITMVVGSALGVYATSVMEEREASGQFARLAGFTEAAAMPYADGLRVHEKIDGTNNTLKLNYNMAILEYAESEAIETLGANATYSDNVSPGDKYVLRVFGNAVTLARLG